MKFKVKEISTVIFTSLKSLENIHLIALTITTETCPHVFIGFLSGPQYNYNREIKI